MVHPVHSALVAMVFAVAVHAQTDDDLRARYPRSDIPELLAALKPESANRELRTHKANVDACPCAPCRLVAIGQPAHRFLLGMLRNPGLGRYPDKLPAAVAAVYPEDLPLLLEVVLRGRGTVQALELMARLGSDAEPALSALEAWAATRQGGSFRLQVAAVREASQTARPKPARPARAKHLDVSVEKLLPCLQSDDAALRWASFRALLDRGAEMAAARVLLEASNGEPLLEALRLWASYEAFLDEAPVERLAGEARARELRWRALAQLRFSAPRQSRMLISTVPAEREALAFELAWRDPHTTVTAHLTQLREDSDPQVRAMAAAAAMRHARVRALDVETAKTRLEEADGQRALMRVGLHGVDGTVDLDDATIDALVRMLKQPSFEARGAQKLLVAAGDRAAQRLAAAYEKSGRAMRVTILRTFAEMRTECVEALRVLLLAAGGDEPVERQTARTAWRKLGSDHADGYLLQGLQSNELRPGALQVLSQLALDPDRRLQLRAARSALIEAVRSGDERQRRSAMSILHNSPDKMPVLAELARDPDPAVRQSATRAWSFEGDDQRYEDQVFELLNDADAGVRSNALFLLGSIRHQRARAVEALIAAWEDATPDVRGNITRALAFQGAAAVSAIPLFERHLDDPDGEVAAGQAWAILSIDSTHQRAAARIAELSKHEDPEVRRRVMWWFANERQAMLVFDHALGLIADEDARVASAAAIVLGHGGARAAEARAALSGILPHANSRVQSYADRALERLQEGKPARDRR